MSDGGSKLGFSSKLGYVLAMAGSAVGLGNIWRFPYLAAKYGGGVFLVTYLVMALTFGYSLMIAENCLGRQTGKGPIGAYRDVCAGKRSFLGCVRIGGWINALVPLIILPYYCVIGGWVTKYVVAMLTTPAGNFSKDATVMVDGVAKSASAQYFVSFITSTWEPLLYFLIFGLILVVVVALGVEKGVERFNKYLMPMLVLLVLAVCVYAMFLPGAKEGIVYYLKPDWGKFSYMTVVAALGQLFFSLSLAMGIAITYGSYMCKEDDLVSSVNQVEVFDTGVAFLAGLMIIPAVVSFGGIQAAESSGPGLVFVVMPQVFASFAGGRVIGTIFFILVLFAAATSAISILETNVQTIGQEIGLTRTKSIVYGCIEMLVIGVVTILGYSKLSFVHPLSFIEKYKGYDILDSLDFISNNVMMPLGAIFTTILIVSVYGLEKFCNEIELSSKWNRKWLFQLCMSTIVIPCLLVILLNALGILH